MVNTAILAFMGEVLRHFAFQYALVLQKLAHRDTEKMQKRNIANAPGSNKNTEDLMEKDDDSWNKIHENNGPNLTENQKISNNSAGEEKEDE